MPICQKFSLSEMRFRSICVPAISGSSDINENRVESINSGPAVRSRELCTWREGLEWHMASLSSEPALARVVPLFSKRGWI